MTNTTTCTQRYAVEEIPDPFDPTSPFVWAITEVGGDYDGGVCDRFASRPEAEEALAGGGYPE